VDEAISDVSVRETRRYLEFVGYGVPDPANTNRPQAMLMAEVAARTDAQAKAIEEIYGFFLEGGRTVKDFIASDVTLEVKFVGYIRGLREVEKGTTQDGVAWVKLRIEKELIEELLGAKLVD